MKWRLHFRKASRVKEETDIKVNFLKPFISLCICIDHSNIRFVIYRIPNKHAHKKKHTETIHVLITFVPSDTFVHGQRLITNLITTWEHKPLITWRKAKMTLENKN